MGKVIGLALIIFIQMYWYKWTRKSSSEWVLLWERTGIRVRETLFELEGLLIKVGQFLSIRADLLPGAFIRQIQDLTDHVPPSDWDAVQDVLEKEWGGRIDDHLLSIEKKAVASASIGEVYKAVLKNGTVVAVKVRRPGIDAVVDTDFRTLRILMWLAARLTPVPKAFINFSLLYREIRQVISKELDFTSEKEALLAFRERFKDRDDVLIPGVHEELSTSRILVMDWLDGVKLTDEQALMKMGLEPGELAGKLLDVFLPQWLEPGIFHADPHGGNMLVSESGALILLDFGMYGEISERDAAAFQELIAGLLAKDYRKAAGCLDDLGFVLPDGDLAEIEEALAELMTFKPESLKEKDLIALKLELNNRIRTLPIQVPARFIFLGRSFITIEGTIRSLVPEDELMSLMRPAFFTWLRNQGDRKWMFIWQWIQSLPAFSFVKPVSEFLNTPKNLEQMKKIDQMRQFHFTVLENRGKQWFQLLLLSLGGCGAGLYADHLLLMQIAIGSAFVSTAGFFYTGSKRNKWLRQIAKRKSRSS
ncbi:ABC1 kinase family protein [Alteribacter lacisalsi]|nr:AarF/UbiB family protein [Alteribacter lacisalsi]